MSRQAIISHRKRWQLMEVLFLCLWQMLTRLLSCISLNNLIKTVEPVTLFHTQRCNSNFSAADGVMLSVCTYL